LSFKPLRYQKWVSNALPHFKAGYGLSDDKKEDILPTFLKRTYTTTAATWIVQKE
jgi:hypothetical protein